MANIPERLIEGNYEIFFGASGGQVGVPVGTVDLWYKTPEGEYGVIIHKGEVAGCTDKDVINTKDDTIIEDGSVAIGFEGEEDDLDEDDEGEEYMPECKPSD